MTADIGEEVTVRDKLINDLVLACYPTFHPPSATGGPMLTAMPTALLWRCTLTAARFACSAGELDG